MLYCVFISRPTIMEPQLSVFRIGYEIYMSWSRIKTHYFLDPTLFMFLCWIGSGRTFFQVLFVEWRFIRLWLVWFFIPSDLWMVDNGSFMCWACISVPFWGVFLVCIGAPFGMNRDRMASFSRCFRWMACFYWSDVWPSLSPSVRLWFDLMLSVWEAFWSCGFWLRSGGWE